MKAENGVYFRREDYAPFWKRVFVDLVDLLVFAFISVLLLFFVPFAGEITKTVFNIVAALLAATAFLYFVVLKRSRFRTLGYRLFGLRIIGLDGNRPSYWALTTRLMFGVAGPLNWIFDLLWLSGDPHRQALRDKFANTYVIKADARPAGVGSITLQQYDILTVNLLFREVRQKPQ